MKLIGIGDGSYTSKKDGQRKEGYRFYFTGQRDNVVGYVCEEVWVRRQIGNDFLQQFPSMDAAIGQECQVFYVRFKSVQAILPMAALAGKK